jgi:predicted nucleotidyltransferase
MVLEGKQTVEDVLQEIVRRIVEAVHPDKIILFGSYARGEANEHSDLDLMVIAPSDAPPGKRTKPILKALRGILFPKDVVWYTQEELDEWADEPGHFVSNVLHEGRVVYAQAT